ncbi:MAG TPA: prepilin-type N-terminal cleavage/methylation domain-containing protein [Chthonomonadaceae bacterium]|nr:prepilin-type N-terminal cleavage/methylation domain-containing protein [Chthonomonadaceae bacterium]
MNRFAQTGRSARRAFSLIEILVVMAIIVILSGITYGIYIGGRSKNAPPGKAHSPMERAKDVVCMEDLRSVRQSIEASRTTDSDNKFPASLDELRLPAELRACPEGKEPYRYDPATGEVHCVHPGHENY